MPTVRREGLSLFYLDRGQGDPVVLLHGFTTSLLGNWERLGWVDLLAHSGFRVLALDLPSHGRSDRTHDAARCSTPSVAADVVALLDHVGVASACIVGFSLGGGVGLRVAIDHAGRVAKLVVAGVGDAALNGLHDPSEIENLVGAFEATEVDAIPDLQARRIRRNADLAGNDPAALLPYLRHGGWPGGIDEPAPIDVPVLVVAAANDEYMRGTRALTEWLPHAAVVEIEGRGHHDLLDDERVRQSVVAFLHGRERR